VIKATIATSTPAISARVRVALDRRAFSAAASRSARVRFFPLVEPALAGPGLVAPGFAGPGFVGPGFGEPALGGAAGPVDPAPEVAGLAAGGLGPAGRAPPGLGAPRCPEGGRGRFGFFLLAILRE
jgi:hypothetical protein